MNVLQISTTDGAGGAGRTARRLHEALRRSGVRSSMAVGSVGAGGPDVVGIASARGGAMGRALRAERVLPKVNRLIGEVPFPFQSSRLLEGTELFRRADVIQLHNLHGNYFDYRVLPRWSATRPVVWALHDMWALSGHCAFSFDCERWRTGCGSCPLFTEEMKPFDEIAQPPWDNTAAEWRRRDRVYRDARLAIVVPSTWLRDLASQSHLAAHPGTTFHLVPYGVDTDRYRPIPKVEARTALGLVPERPVVVFGAASLRSRRKGFQELLEALRHSVVREHDPQLVTIGDAGDLVREVPSLVSLGSISDEDRQATIYSAADLTVIPSLADNQPLVALEAMACGTPVVAFAVGGVPEVVREDETGVCVPAGDAGALATAIGGLLGDEELCRRLSEGARRYALERHRVEAYAQHYRELYSSLLDQRQREI